MTFTWTFQISRPANLFHLVNNLSEWHFSARQRYNRAWIEETGQLTAAEQEALDAYRQVVPRYPYGPRWLGRAFVLATDDADAWARARQLLAGEELATLRRVLATFEPRFGAIWAGDRPRLEHVRDRLDAALRSDGVTRAVDRLERYLAARAPHLTIDLLLSRGQGSSAGGANEAPDHVTLEVLELEDMATAADVLLHELGHLLERAHFLPRYDAFAAPHRLHEQRGERGWSAYFLIKEALNGALCPSGCLSPLYGVPCADHAQDAARSRQAGNARHAGLGELTGLVLPLVRAYLDVGRPADEALFESAHAAFAAHPHTLC